MKDGIDRAVAALERIADSLDRLAREATALAGFAFSVMKRYADKHD